MAYVDDARPSQASESGVNPARSYHIRIKGALGPAWSEWFDGFTITYADTSGETTLSGHVPDQAALHGLLAKIRDLNLELISVERRPSHE